MTLGFILFLQTMFVLSSRTLYHRRVIFPNQTREWENFPLLIHNCRHSQRECLQLLLDILLPHVWSADSVITCIRTRTWASSTSVFSLEQDGKSWRCVAWNENGHFYYWWISGNHMSRLCIRVEWKNQKFWFLFWIVIKTCSYMK